MSRYRLQRDEHGLALVDTFSHQHPLHIDFGGPEFSYRLRRGGGRRELLAKAVGARGGVRVLDCTAGLGRDAFLLAHLGCEVVMVERSTVIAALLADALVRAAGRPDLERSVRRLTLVHGDARDVLGAGGTFDAITIDPMFPVKRKSALARGEMQLLQRFLGQDGDVLALLACARETGVRRVVLKRPLAAATIGSPSHALKGRSSRFDVYVQ